MIEAQIRQAFGVASESTAQAERERLQESRLAEQKLQREVGKTREELERRRSSSIRRREEIAQQVDAAERERQELQEELSYTRQLLDLEEKAKGSALLEKEQLEATYVPLENEVVYLRSLVSQRQSWGSAPSERSAQLADTQAGALLQGMVEVLREGTARQTPRQILELVDRVSPGCLVLLPSALKSADEASGFEYGEKLFDYVWKLATAYRQLRLQGGPDVVATQVFGNNVWAAKESQTTAQNAVGKAERTFAYKGEPLLMLQHLKIGVKDSPNRTLRLHFEWDAEDSIVVIGHCGPHLFVQGH